MVPILTSPSLRPSSGPLQTLPSCAPNVPWWPWHSLGLLGHSCPWYLISLDSSLLRALRGWLPGGAFLPIFLPLVSPPSYHGFTVLPQVPPCDSLLMTSLYFIGYLSCFQSTSIFTPTGGARGVIDGDVCCVPQNLEDFCVQSLSRISNRRSRESNCGSAIWLVSSCGRMRCHSRPFPSLAPVVSVPWRVQWPCLCSCGLCSSSRRPVELKIRNLHAGTGRCWCNSEGIVPSGKCARKSLVMQKRLWFALSQTRQCFRATPAVR